MPDMLTRARSEAIIAGATSGSGLTQELKKTEPRSFFWFKIPVV